MARLKIVGIMGSGKSEFLELAELAGQVVAELGYHLLTGAGGGVMLAAARAFTQNANRKGLSLGIVRSSSLPDLRESRRLWAPRTDINPYIEVPIKTHLPESGEKGQSFYSRNHINVLTADVVVVLPGDAGTLSEFELARQYGRPIVLFLGMRELNGHSATSLKNQYGDRVQVARDKVELAECLQKGAGESWG